MAVHIVIGTPKFMRKSGGRFILWQSARGLAQSKTLRVFQGIIVSRAASWSAVALHRFLPSACQTVPMLIETAIQSNQDITPLTETLTKAHHRGHEVR
jgi:hypothetical protein